VSGGDDGQHIWAFSSVETEPVLEVGSSYKSTFGHPDRYTHR
jgi:hypothetical protein